MCMCTCGHITRIYSGCVSMYEFGMYLFIICTVGILCLSMCVYNPSIYMACSIYLDSPFYRLHGHVLLQ